MKPGDLVKKKGLVRYANGERMKVSKKTWLISRVEGDKLFYKQTFTDQYGRSVEEEVELKLPKEDGEFVLVGDENGLFDEYKPTEIVSAGSVQEKYRVLKAQKYRGWKEGDIVAITGKVSFKTLEKGILEKVPYETEHQHILIVVDPVSVFSRTNT